MPAKQKIQWMMSTLLGMLDDSKRNRVSIDITYKSNNYKIELLHCCVTSMISGTPDKLELEMYRYGIIAGLECDVDLGDAVLFYVIPNGHKFVAKKVICVRANHITKDVSPYIIAKDNGVYVMCKKTKVPGRIADVITDSINSGGKLLVPLFASAYFSDCNKAYNYRMRSFLRMVAKCDNMRFFVDGKFVVSIDIKLLHKTDTADKAFCSALAEEMFIKLFSLNN